MLLRTKALLVGCTLLLAACEPQPAEPAAPLSVTSFSFNLVDTTSTPLVGVNVAEMVDGSSLSLGQTSDAGSISVVDHETGQLTVTFAKEGYAPQVWTGDLQAPQAERIVMIQREAAQTIAAGDAADVEGKDGASVEVAADAFVGADGLPYTGPINVNITPVDIASDATEAAAFPGSFNAVLESGVEQPLITYGTVEYHFTDENGNELQLAEGQTATIEIPVYTLTHPDGSTIQIGDVIPFWYLDEDTGIWHEDGEGTVVASESSPTGLAQRGEVSHFTWWNCDVSPNPATVTIETTLPDFADRNYHLEYIAKPVSSTASARVDGHDYVGGGLATYNSYIPSNTNIVMGINLYRYLADERTQYVLIDSWTESRFFPAGDNFVIEVDFSESDIVGELPEPVGVMYDPTGAEIGADSPLKLVPDERMNFKFISVTGLPVTVGEALYRVVVTDGPEWLGQYLAVNAKGEVSFAGKLPAVIEAAPITLDIRDTDGNVYITLVSAIEPLERLSIQSDVSSIAMAQDNFVDISVPEISGGYEPYTVSLLPTYVIAAPYISVERLASGDFRISGLREGASTARFVLSDASGKYLSGAEIDVVVVNSPPTIQPISDVNLNLDGSVSIVPESTGLGIEWSYSGSLPSGVILNTQTGELSGTPSVIGTFPVTLIATNPVGAVSTPFTLSVNPQFIGTVSGVDLDLPALSGIAAQQWQIVDGDLPSGLTLNSETGVISGTATEGGDFHLVISADGNEIEFTLSVLVVVVNQAPTISVSMPDYLKAGIQTVINFEASDPDGDLLDITAEVVAGADLVTIAEITETQISLDVVASATHGDEIILAVTATDPSGAAAGQLISTRTEHLIYPEGMINPSMNVSVDIPVEGAFNVVDIGDACIAYYRYVFAAVSGGGYAYGGHYFFDKATSNWGEENNTVDWVYQVHKVSSTAGHSVWYGRDANNLSVAGLILDNELVEFSTYPGVYSTGTVPDYSEILSVVKDDGSVRIFLYGAGTVYFSDDLGESWSVSSIHSVLETLPPKMSFVHNIVFANNGGQLVSSSDFGETWSSVNTTEVFGSYVVGRIDYSSEAGLFMLSGNFNGTEGGVYTSGNGIDWSPLSIEDSSGNVLLPSGSFNKIYYHSGVWTVLSTYNNNTQGLVIESVDGLHWKVVQNGQNPNPYSYPNTSTVAAEMSDCLGVRQLYTDAGYVYQFNGISQTYTRQDSADSGVKFVSLPEDGASGITYVSGVADYNGSGPVTMSRTLDGINWESFSPTLDGDVLYADSWSWSVRDNFRQLSADNWVFQNEASSVDGMTFSTYPEVDAPLFYDGSYTNQAQFDTFDRIIDVDVTGGVWEKSFENGELQYLQLGNFGEGFVAEDLLFVSRYANGRFYIGLSREFNSVSSTALIQYSPESGFTVESGCWDDNSCDITESVAIVPVEKDHFLLVSAWSNTATAVQFVKTPDGIWNHEPVSVDNQTYLGRYNQNKAMVRNSGTEGRWLLSYSGNDLMSLYDAEAKTIQGPVRVNQDLVKDAMRQGDQIILTTHAPGQNAPDTRVNAYAMPLDTFSRETPP